jgi:DNA-binding transcriptional MocR family regulator
VTVSVPELDRSDGSRPMPGEGLDRSRAPPRVGGTGIRDLLEILGAPDVLSLAGGTPDPALLPVADLRTAYESVLARPETAGEALQYSSSQGHPSLRNEIARRMVADGVPCTSDNIAITAGSQQALDLLGKLFIWPGDTVAVGRPTYLGAIQAFDPYRPRYVELSAGACAAEPALSIVYVVPDFHNPTGRRMSVTEREALLAQTSGVLIEDAAYRPLAFDGSRQPSLLELDCRRCGSIEKARTIFCGTLSKTVSPGLRIGWICAPARVIDKIALLKQGADVHASTINQLVAARVLRTEPTDRLLHVRTEYARRAEALQDALTQSLAGVVTWTRPEGGFFTWVELPPMLDASRLLKRSITEAKVAFVPGAAFFARTPSHACLRLSCSMLPPDAIAEAVARLSRVIKESLNDHPGPE